MVNTLVRQQGLITLKLGLLVLTLLTQRSPALRQLHLFPWGDDLMIGANNHLHGGRAW